MRRAFHRRKFPNLEGPKRWKFQGWLTNRPVPRGGEQESPFCPLDSIPEELGKPRVLPSQRTNTSLSNRGTRFQDGKKENHIRVQKGQEPNIGPTQGTTRRHMRALRKRGQRDKTVLDHSLESPLIKGEGNTRREPEKRGYSLRESKNRELYRRCKQSDASNRGERNIIAPSK